MKRKNIVFIGMIGCGKTEVGRKTAEKAGMRFIDLDAEIVRVSGRSISEIFAQKGERAFRRIESKCLRSALKSDNTVISCGGGIVCRRRNRAALSRHFTVWLQRERDRIDSESMNRPPVYGSAEAYEALLKKRLPLYEQCADVTVQNTVIERSVELVLEAIDAAF